MNNLLLGKFKETGRNIDVLLIENLEFDKSNEIIEELRKYQNVDLGFGNSLEPDLRVPSSTVLCTNMAVNILDEIKYSLEKEKLIKEIISYYEMVFDYENYCFTMTTPDVNNYPRAIWWNYESSDDYDYLNPNPEICGFLNQYHQFVTKIDLKKFNKMVIAEITGDNFCGSSMHSLLSVLLYYKRSENVIKNKICPYIKMKIDNMIKSYDSESDTYDFEPVDAFIISSKFINGFEDKLEDNINMLQIKINNNELIYPKWTWYQYEDYFKKYAKEEWASYLTFKAIKVLTKYNKKRG